MEIVNTLHMMMEETRAGKRDSVISSFTTDCATIEERDAWRQLRNELEEAGIPGELIQEKHQEIVAWFQQAIACGALSESNTELETERPTSSGSSRWSDARSRLSNRDDISSAKSTSSGSNIWSNAKSRLSYREDISSSRPTSFGSSIWTSARSRFSYHEDIIRRRSSSLFFHLNAPEALPTRPSSVIEQSSPDVNTNPSHLEMEPTNSTPETGKKEVRLSSRRLPAAAVAKNSPLRKGLINKFINSKLLLDFQTNPMLKAVKTGDVKIFEHLISKNHPTNLRDEEGNTLLMTAAQHGHIEVLRLLLKQKLDTEEISNVQKMSTYVGIDHSGWRALHFACRSPDGVRASECVSALLDAGANITAITADKFTPIHVAAYFGNQQVVTLLLERGSDISAVTADLAGSTPLHLASLNGHSSLVEYLLSKGVYIDERSGTGRTALHEAIEGGHDSTVELLISKKADIEDSINLDGYTPLHRAVSVESESIIQMLIDRGADIEALTVEHDRPMATPICLAFRNHSENAMRLLFKNGAQINTVSSGLNALWDPGPNDVKMLKLILELRPDLVGDKSELNRFVRADLWDGAAIREARYVLSEVTRQMLKESKEKP